MCEQIYNTDKLNKIRGRDDSGTPYTREQAITTAMLSAMEPIMRYQNWILARVGSTPLTYAELRSFLSHEDVKVTSRVTKATAPSTSSTDVLSFKHDSHMHLTISKT